MIGIYKYENKKNGKIYIGSYFNVVKECTIKNIKEREKYWIEYYKSYTPLYPNTGYNLTRGGEEYYSDENSWPKLTVNKVEEIIAKLVNTTISIQQLSKDYGVHYNTISDINRCKTWTWLHNYKKNIRKEFKERQVMCNDDY